MSICNNLTTQIDDELAWLCSFHFPLFLSLPTKKNKQKQADEQI